MKATLRRAEETVFLQPLTSSIDSSVTDSPSDPLVFVPQAAGHRPLASGGMATRNMRPTVNFVNFSSAPRLLVAVQHRG